MATWNASFLAQPKQTDTPTQGDDEIRGLRAAIQERIKNEHTTYDADGTSGTASKDWLHKAGSAVGFYAATASAPTTRLNGEALTAGQLWYDSTVGALKVWTGAAWVNMTYNFRAASIQGVLVSGASSPLPPIVVPLACTISKVSARVLTSPGTQSILLDIHAFNTSGTDQGSIFSAAAERITITAGSYWDISTSFSAAATLSADYYLMVYLDQVGVSPAGADLGLSIMAS